MNHTYPAESPSAPGHRPHHTFRASFPGNSTCVLSPCTSTGPRRPTGVPPRERLTTGSCHGVFQYEESANGVANGHSTLTSLANVELLLNRRHATLRVWSRGMGKSEQARSPSSSLQYLSSTVYPLPSTCRLIQCGNHNIDNLWS